MTNINDGLHWRRRRDGWWQRSSHRPMWSPAFESIIFHLPEYEAFEACLLAHPVLGKQMNALVGALGGAVRREPRHLALQILPEPDAVGGPHDFDQRWDAAISHWLDDQIERVTIVPLPGLRTESGSVVLDSRTSLAPLAEEEVASCLSSQCLMDYSSHLGLFQEPPGGVTGLRMHLRYTKIIGEQGHDLEAFRATAEDEALRADLVSQCLALVGHGALRMEPRLTFLGIPGGGGGHSWTGTGVLDPHPQAVLSREAESQVRQVWAAITDERFRANRALNLALRRLTYARRRSQLEDSLMDLMISCEAFFLSDADGELGYRLALRGAYWSDAEGLTRREVFNIYKAAYSARSAIAHGSEIKSKSLRVRGEVLSLSDFVLVVEALVSRALLKAVRRAGAHHDHKLVIDWDGLLMSE